MIMLFLSFSMHMWTLTFSSLADCGMLLPLIVLHASSACAFSRCGTVSLALAALAAWYLLASVFTVKLHAYKRGVPAISISGL